MSNVKEYTKETTPEHKLVKAARLKGLTGVKITWRGALARYTRGWFLESNEVSYLRLGGTLAAAKKKIDQLTIL